MTETGGETRSADEQEFPQAPKDWAPEDALRQAEEEGLTLGEDHWQALRALQEYFARNEEGARVHVRELHDALDEKFHAEGGMRHLYGLFPGGPVAQGCRLAGLPVPPGSVEKSFGSVQ